jgi:aminoglycoside phosphotransferase (APT) family kinase protein
MASVERTVAREVLSTTRTFRGRPFRLSSIYNRHNEEKCFRVTDKVNRVCYKVRFATASSRNSVKREHEALQYLKRRGFGWAPRIYETKLDEAPYLITSFAEGASLDKSLIWIPHASKIVRDLRNRLADIHSIKGNYYGHLGGKPYETWLAFFEVRLWRHVIPLTPKFLKKKDLKAIQMLFEEAREALASVGPTLLHGDVKPANVLFDSRTSKTQLIDYELARFGDVDFEFTKISRMAVRWAEYEKLVAEPLIEPVFDSDLKSEYTAKLSLYHIYHACSFLDFEVENDLPIQRYRLEDLEELLGKIR